MRIPLVLQAQHPRIEQIDFFDLNPKGCYDAVVLSMVGTIFYFGLMGKTTVMSLLLSMTLRSGPQLRVFAVETGTHALAHSKTLAPKRTHVLDGN